MIKISRIIENVDFRTIDFHLKLKSYSIRVTENEIDLECEKHGINPLQQRIYATPVTYSRNMLAQDIAERKLLEILGDEILGIPNDCNYIVKNSSDWDSIQSHFSKTGIKFLGQL